MSNPQASRSVASLARVLALALALAVLVAWTASPAGARDGDASGLSPVARLQDGLPLDVLVVGSTAYLGLDSGIAIEDVGDASAPRRLGGLSLPSPARGLALSGSLLLVANGQSGLAIIDVADPSAPFIVNRVPGADVQAIALVGGLAYLAEADGGPPSVHGLRIVDVSDPASASELSFTSLGNGALSVAVAGGVAHVGLGSDLGLPRGLALLDVSDPFTPLARGFLDLGKPVHDIALSGSVAHLAIGFPLDGDLVCADVSNPSAPVRLGGLRLPDMARGIALVGSTAHVAARTAGLVTVDVGDPSAPRRLDALATGREAWSVAARGDASFLGERSSRGQGGFGAVATPSAPARLSELVSQPYSEAVGVAAIGGTLFALHRDGLSIHDATDPAAPAWLGEWTEPGLNLSGLAVDGALAAVAMDDAVRLVDVGDAFAPAPVGVVPLGFGVPVDLVLDTDRLLVATGRGVELWDVASPATPSLLGVHDAGVWASGVAVDGDRACLVAEDRLQVLDLGGPGAPILLGELSIADSLFAVAADGAIAVATGFAATLHVIDLSDPASPVLLSTLPGPSGFDVVLRGERAFVAVGEEGVRVVDLSDPASPAVQAWLDSSGSASALAVDGATVHLAAGSSQHWLLGCSACVAPCLAVASVDPGAITLCAGTELRLDGSASVVSGCAGGALEYQWHEGGAPLAGETGSELLIADSHADGVFDFRLDVRCSTDPACADSATSRVTLLADSSPTIDRESLRVRKLDPASEALAWVVSAGSGEANVHRTPVASELSAGSLDAATLVGVSARSDWSNAAIEPGGVLFFRVYPRGDCSGDSIPDP